MTTIPVIGCPSGAATAPPYAHNPMHVTPHPIHQLIRDRRSVKPALMDAERPLDRALVERLLEAARWAPNHGLTEPWRFHLFTGAARQTLADKLRDLYQKHTPPALFRPDKLEKLGVTPLLAPVVLTIGMKRDPSGRISETDEICAVACAMQNLHLAAAAEGLAGYWSSPPIVDCAEMKTFIDLDAHDRCLGLFYLGWPRAELALESRREAIDRKVTWRA